MRQSLHAHRFVFYARVLIILIGVLGITMPINSQTAGQVKDRQLIQPESTARSESRGKRIALVIGNSSYRYTARLENPINDAKDIGDTLAAIGFEVIRGKDESSDSMKSLIKQFGERLSNGGSIGLFYYAGHGVQVAGRNYLIPIEVDRLRESTIEFDAVDVNRVLKEMEASGSYLNIVILDACRTNPFTRAWRTSESGLAHIDIPTGTLIAYATAPGTVANDGTGRNGLYTAELLRQMRSPGLTLEQMFKEVRRQVMRQTGGTQVPWESTMVVGDFYFSTSSGDTVTGERELWESIKNSGDPDDFRSYLKHYPGGTHTPLAENTLRRLDAERNKSTRSLDAPGTSVLPTRTSIPKEKQKQSKALAVSGDAHRMKGENDLAIRDLTEAIRLNPNNAGAYAIRGAAYLAKDNKDLAILDFTASVRADPRYAWAYAMRAHAYKSMNALELALSDLNEVIRLDPRDYWAYDRRGEIYRLMGKNDLAAVDEGRQMNDLTESIRRKPNQAEPYLNRCDAYRMKSKFDLALPDCTEAIRLDPKNAQAYSTRGDIYRLKGSYDMALRDLNEGILLSPNWYWAYERRADTYRGMGQYAAASADDQKAKELKNN